MRLPRAWPAIAFVLLVAAAAGAQEGRETYIPPTVCGGTHRIYPRNLFDRAAPFVAVLAVLPLALAGWSAWRRRGPRARLLPNLERALLDARPQTAYFPAR